MKKKLPVILSIILLLIITGGGFYYKYNYVDTVTDYKVIKVTPPVENYFGTYSDHEIEIQTVRQYENDSVAEIYERKRLEQHRNYLNTHITKEVESQKDDLQKQVMIDVYKKLLSQEWTLISITHTRSFNSKPLAKLIKQYGLGSEKTRNYIRQNKIQVLVYPL